MGGEENNQMDQQTTEVRQGARSAIKMFFDLYLEDFGVKYAGYEHIKFLKRLKELGYPQNIYVD